MAGTSQSFAHVYRDDEDRVFFRLSERQGRTINFAVEADNAATLDRWLEDNGFSAAESEETHAHANVVPFVRTSSSIH